MENIYLTPEHELLREQIARFVAREVEPHALAWEEAGLTPREVLRKLGDAGLLGLMYAEEYGGGEADALTNLVFAEALSQSTFGGFIITVLVHTDMASPHLHHAGSAEQKATLHAGRDGGRARSPPSRITEPGAGLRRRRHPHDGDALGRRQRMGPERHQALHHQRRATPTCTSSPPRPATARHAMSMFIVEKGTPGFTRRPLARQVGLALVRHRRAGVRQLPHPGRQPARRGEPRLLFGDEELPDRAHRARRDGDRPLHAGADASRSITCASDKAFGGTLFDKQVVRQKLAMLDAKVRAARSFMYHCAWRVTQGHDVVQEVSMLKALTGELVNEVVSGCQQFHGGMGYMRGTVIERLWRDARVLAIGGGATEVMLDEVAKRY